MLCSRVSPIFPLAESAVLIAATIEIQSSVFSVFKFNLVSRVVFQSPVVSELSEVYDDCLYAAFLDL
jgi:hypothetical protein